MSAERVTVTLDAEVLAYVREQAEVEGLSLSAWLSRVVDRRRKIDEGKRAIAEILVELRSMTPTVDGWAHRLTRAALAGADQDTLDRIMAEHQA